LMTEHLDARDDAVLAEGKAFDAMIARRTKGPPASLTLHDRRIS
jgi:hypothetical protein